MYIVIIGIVLFFISVTIGTWGCIKISERNERPSIHNTNEEEIK